MKMITVGMVLVFSLLIVGCAEEEAAPEAVEETQMESTGDLFITCNGEDFVRSGFVSVDGWQITFRHVFVTVTDINVYQTDPAYDPHTGEEIVGQVQEKLDGVYTIDLAAGDENADPIAVGSLENVPEGHYNAISWKIIPAVDGLSEGYSIYIDAQAVKGEESYDVILGFESSYSYTAGEYIGDERKGFVASGTPGDLELTFHFDHIFGDFDQPADDNLNVMAIGFEPFAELMQEGTVDENLASLSEKLSHEIYTKLVVDVLPTLGHTGEGHCHCVVLN